MVNETPVQPKLADLLAGFLLQQANAHASGLASFDAEAEVLPFEAGPVQPMDAKLAWEENLAVARWLTPTFDVAAWPAPPLWPSLVAAHEPVVALACALGNFPQLVRHFYLILQTPDLGQLRPAGGRPVTGPALLDWVKKAGAKNQFPQLVLALGTLRLAKQFAEADQLIQAHEASIPAAWRLTWDNEKAALAWHRGQAEVARDLWRKLPDSIPVLFNRGMTELFLDNPAAAQAPLTQAVAQMPEEGAWHHLGKLYLAFTHRRG